MNSALHIQAEQEVVSPTALSLAKRQKPILTLEGLQKHYTIETSFLQRLFTNAKTETIKAVDNIQLELYEGEIFGLVGESGCGKSTLSRTILQLIPATGGSVKFCGEEQIGRAHV